MNPWHEGNSIKSLLDHSNSPICCWAASDIVIVHRRYDYPMILVLLDMAPQGVSPHKASIANWAVKVGLTDGFHKGHFFFCFLLDFLLFCLSFPYCVYLLWMSLVHMTRQNRLCLGRVCTIVAFIRSSFLMFLKFDIYRIESLSNDVEILNSYL